MDAAEQGHRLVLYHILDLRSAGELQHELVRALDRAGPVVLDAGAVTRMSTAAVQLILSFLRTAQKRGVKASVIGLTPVFLSAFDALGLETMLAGGAEVQT